MNERRIQQTQCRLLTNQPVNNGRWKSAKFAPCKNEKRRRQQSDCRRLETFGAGRCKSVKDAPCENKEKEDHYVAIHETGS